jgi:hypothetical protein
MIRIDLVFSYWIFVWYLLYEFKIVKYSPKLALIVGIFFNIILLFIKIYYKNSINNILLFCIIVIIMKIIPLWRLRNNTVYDLKSLIILYIIYLIWLIINNTNNYIIYKKQLQNIKNNKASGPLIKYINKLNKYE